MSKPTPTKRIEEALRYLSNWADSLDERKGFVAQDLYDEDIEMDEFRRTMGCLGCEEISVYELMRIIREGL